jgi:polygalacturonase
MNISLPCPTADALQTQLIQSAIDTCAAHGGGTLTFEAGIHRTGTLRLRSNITLYLQAGAVLQGSEKIEDYPALDFRHNEFPVTRSLLWAIGEDNIALTGFGRIDFRGSAFMQLDTPDTRGPGGHDIPSLPEALQREAVVVANERPTQPVFFHECQRVRIENISLTDSPCWTFTLSCCGDVQVRGISVRNSLVIPNCDGVNISASRNVIVTGCNFHCADDCVAVVGITRWEQFCENIIISDCTMVSRSCAVRVGHLASKVRNVQIHHLILSEGNRGIGIFAGDGGSVENVQTDHLILNTHLFAGFWWGKGEPLILSAADSTGTIRNVRISNVQARSEGPIVITGKDSNVSGIVLEDWDMTLVPSEKRRHLGNWIDLQPAQCRPLELNQFPWIYQEGVKNVTLRDILVHPEAAEAEGYQPEKIGN